MNKTFKKTLALFLCIWMVCLTGIASFAASEEPYITPTSVKISNETISIVYGGTAQLTASVEPAGADQTITWSSSNINLVAVDNTGKLIAAKDTAESPSGKQTVIITATCTKNANLKATCTVTVDNDITTKLSAVLKILKTLFTAMVGAFSDPAKQFGTALIDFFKKLMEMLPKSA